jgi:hypothetical protein
MIANTFIQPALFEIKRPFPFDRDYGFVLTGFQPPIPGYDDCNKWRVAGLDSRIGTYKGIGYCHCSEISGGYMIFLEFEDGRVEAFHPYSLFPVVN